MTCLCGKSNLAIFVNIVLLAYHHAHCFCVVCGYLSALMAELSSYLRKCLGPQSLKHLPSYPFQKKFAKLWPSSVDLTIFILDSFTLLKEDPPPNVLM